jgi:hypothetical protein
MLRPVLTRPSGVRLLNHSTAGVYAGALAEIDTLAGTSRRSILAGVRHGRGALALLIVVLIAGLAPVAFADPPDPTWIGGYWDDDDFDNVVAFIASSCAALVEGAADDGPVLAPVAPVQPIEPYARPVVHRPSAPSRAPPVSLLSGC